MDLQFRQIEKADNKEIALLIRGILDEYGVGGPGTVYVDPSTDALFELFRTSGSVYWVATLKEKIIGGCGIFPTEGLPPGYGELVKLYVSSSHTGKGIGRILMEKSIQSARELNYSDLYLETMPELAKAVGLYKSLGFTQINQPLGDTGHFACELRMISKL